jgi:hypothetical protein
MMNQRPARVPIRSASQSKAALAPLLAELIASVKHGFGQWKRLGHIDHEHAVADESPLRSPLSSRTRASWVYDHIVQEARRRLGGRPGVTLSTSRGFLLVLVGDAFSVRFKKLDAKGLARNYQTRAQTQFSFQLEMFGLGQETRITCGYQLDQLATEIADILIACPDGPYSNAWQYSALEELGGMSAPEPANEPAPIVPLAPAGETTIEVDPSKVQREGADSKEAGA